MYRGSRRKRGNRAFLLRLAVTGGLMVLTLVLLAQRVCARTYVITDGERVLTCTSLDADPVRILDQAGLALREQDTYTTTMVGDTAQITVRRAQRISVTCHGQTSLATSSGETVRELLSRLGLTPAGEDGVSHGMDTYTYDGMHLYVDRKVTREETYVKTLPHETSYYSDGSIPEGTQEILIPGVDGQLRCTAAVTYVGGVEVSRQLLREAVITPAVTEVIGQGTGKPPEPAENRTAPVIRDGYIYLPTGEVLTYYKTESVQASAYTHSGDGSGFVTASGTTVRHGTVAVDPQHIPYGTRMFILSDDGSCVYGIAVAEDKGADLKGSRVGLYMPTYMQCARFGRKRCTLYYLG